MTLLLLRVLYALNTNEEIVRLLIKALNKEVLMLELLDSTID